MEDETNNEIIIIRIIKIVMYITGPLGLLSLGESLGQLRNFILLEMVGRYQFLRDWVLSFLPFSIDPTVVDGAFIVFPMSYVLIAPWGNFRAFVNEKEVSASFLKFLEKRWMRIILPLIFSILAMTLSYYMSYKFLSDNGVTLRRISIVFFALFGLIVVWAFGGKAAKHHRDPGVRQCHSAATTIITIYFLALLVFVVDWTVAQFLISF